jgi:hypothetical protein
MSQATTHAASTAAAMPMSFLMLVANRGAGADVVAVPCDSVIAVVF